MANDYLPPDPPPGDTIRPDAGDWISGAGISFDEVPAAEVAVNDRLLLGDKVVAVVTRVKHGKFWLLGALGSYLGQVVSIRWEQDGGNAKGTLVQPAGDMVRRVTGRCPVNGPFETADEARELPEVRAILAGWTPGHKLADGASELLCQALDDAGVTLGAYDRYLTAWMGGFEPQVAAVIASWVTRAARGAR